MKISELPQAPVISDDDLLVIVSNGATQKIEIGQLIDHIKEKTNPFKFKFIEEDGTEER